MNLRRSARAVALDEDDRILLYRFTIPEPSAQSYCRPPAEPSSGVETPIAGLHRELKEEAGMAVDAGWAHVSRQPLNVLTEQPQTPLPRQSPIWHC